MRSIDTRFLSSVSSALSLSTVWCLRWDTEKIDLSGFESDPEPTSQVILDNDASSTCMIGEKD